MIFALHGRVDARGGLVLRDMTEALGSGRMGHRDHARWPHAAEENWWGYSFDGGCRLGECRPPEQSTERRARFLLRDRLVVCARIISLIFLPGRAG